MKFARAILKTLLVTAVAVAGFAPSPLFACATCFGQSDAPMAQGMNWGIFTLLAVIVTVLVSIAGFFIYIIRKAAAQAAKNDVENLSEVKV